VGLYHKNLLTPYFIMENEMDAEFEDLDTSWIDKEEKMFSENPNDLIGPLDEIELFFVYMDSANAISKIDNEMESLNGSGILSNERLLQIVQNKRSMGGIKYKLDDIIMFEIPIDAKSLQTFVKSDNIDENQFIKSVSILKEVVISSSMFIFHDITGIWFFLSEVGLKSALKANSVSRATKKVRIVDDTVSDEVYMNNKRKSMKLYMKKAKNTRKNMSS